MVTHLLTAMIASGIAIGSSAAAAPSQESLEQAARDYRIQVYNTFHSDRPEFDHRRAEWDRLKTDWESVGKPEGELPALLDWLAMATALSQPESIGPLPESPRIAADPQSPKKSAAQWLIQVPGVDNEPSAVTSSPVQPSPSPTKADAPTGAKVAPTAPDDQLDPSKTATPVSSKSNLELPAIEEKKPVDETAPESTPVGPNFAPKDGAAAERPKGAGNGDWLHALGEQFGEDLNDLAVTLAWKRESK